MQQNANGRVYFLYVHYCKNIFLNKEVIKTARESYFSRNGHFTSSPSCLININFDASANSDPTVTLWAVYISCKRGTHCSNHDPVYFSPSNKKMPGSLIFSANILVFFLSLTHFSPVSHFYTPWKRRKTYGFLMFSGGIAMWHWTKMG